MFLFTLAGGLETWLASEFLSRTTIGQSKAESLNLSSVLIKTKLITLNWLGLVVSNDQSGPSFPDSSVPCDVRRAIIMSESRVSILIRCQPFHLICFLDHFHLNKYSFWSLFRNLSVDARLFMSSRRELCNCRPLQRPPELNTPCPVPPCQMRNDGGHYARCCTLWLYPDTPSPAPAASYSIPGRAPHLPQCNIISGQGYFPLWGDDDPLITDCLHKYLICPS